MVCVSVCLLVTFVSSANTAEPIEMPFGWMTLVNTTNHVLGDGRDPVWKGVILEVVRSIERHCKA